MDDLHCSFIDDISVGSNMPTDQGLSKAPGCFDHDLGGVTIDRIYCEYDARGFRVYHFLDADADEDLLMREALFFPIQNCSRPVEPGQAHLNKMDELVFASDVYERLLFPCHAILREVARIF